MADHRTLVCPGTRPGQREPLVAVFSAVLFFLLCKRDRELVGSLLCLALATRPDIAVAVNKLARLVNKPTITHWKIAKSLLRYLVGALNLGRVYKANVKAKLTGYVDASWADGPGRNSAAGYLCYYGENLPGLVDWASKLQDAPAHSTAESELMAAGELARNLAWLRTLFKELGIEQKEPTIMNEDNQACIRISEGGGNFSKRKHMDLRYHYLAIFVAVCLPDGEGGDQAMWASRSEVGPAAWIPNGGGGSGGVR